MSPDRTCHEPKLQRNPHWPNLELGFQEFRGPSVLETMAEGFQGTRLAGWLSADVKIWQQNIKCQHAEYLPGWIRVCKFFVSRFLFYNWEIKQHPKTVLFFTAVFFLLLETLPAIMMWQCCICGQRQHLHPDMGLSSVKRHHKLSHLRTGSFHSGQGLKSLTLSINTMQGFTFHRCCNTSSAFND